MSKLLASSLLLVLVGSATDAIMILAFNVLTAAQTGNTILFAVAIARGDAVTGLSSAISIGSFLVGALAGGWVCRRARPIAAPILEVVLLVLALGLWLPADGHPGATKVNVLVALAATAMGIQSAFTIHMHGQPGTYVTGLLTSFAVSLGSSRDSTTGPSAVQGLVWVLYLAGAIFSGFAFVVVGPLALLVPISALMTVALLFARTPTTGSGTPGPSGK